MSDLKSITIVRPEPVSIERKDRLVISTPQPTTVDFKWWDNKNYKLTIKDS